MSHIEKLPTARRISVARDSILSKNAAAEEINFLHTTLAICGLPHKNPGDEFEFIRRRGNVSLLITAGKLLDTGTGKWVQQGLPYGSRARLLLIHLCTEAVRHHSPEIDIGNSMSAFMRRLGFQVSGGKNGSINGFKQQLNRLAASRMQLGGAGPDGLSIPTMNAHPIDKMAVWFTRQSPRLWDPTIVLSDGFFRALEKFAVQLDNRALGALSHNSMALDIYLWLAHRLCRIDRPAFVSWASLMEQFGDNYARLYDFKKRFLIALHQALAVYPKARLQETGHGLKLIQSHPPVVKLLHSPTGGQKISYL